MKFAAIFLHLKTVNSASQNLSDAIATKVFKKSAKRSEKKTFKSPLLKLYFL